MKALDKFLEEDADESIHEYIQTNILTATRNFVHRVNCFKRDIMMGINNSMNIKKFSWKVEYQGRGAGHIHGTLWCNLRKVAVNQCNEMVGEIREISSLEKAFKSLRQNEELPEEEKQSLIKFAEKFTTCTLNGSKATEHLDNEEDIENQGRQIIQIVKQCQIHHHTKTCKKRDGNCRFNFPKFPMWKTILAGGVSSQTPEDREESISKNHSTLQRVREVLEDKETMNIILSDYNMEEENKFVYDVNRKKK